jgi:hypothetical protein
MNPIAATMKRSIKNAAQVCIAFAIYWRLGVP